MSPRDPDPRSLLLGLDGPEVRLTGRTAYRLAGVLDAALARARRNGEVLDPEVLAVVDAVVYAGALYQQRQTSHERNVQAQCPTELPPSGHGLLDTASVAQLLQCSVRNVQHLAASGKLAPAAHVGRAMMFDPVIVAEYSEQRTARRQA